MLVYKHYCRELKPNNRQRVLFAECSGYARFVYNWGLKNREEFKANRANIGLSIGYVDQTKTIVKMKQTKQYSWMGLYSKSIARGALQNLATAFVNYSNPNGHYGYPKLKKKGRCRDAFRLEGSIRPKGSHVYLPRLGPVRLKEKTAALSGNITSCTIFRYVDKWFCSFLVAHEIEEPAALHTQDAVGIDLGVKTFGTLSDGSTLQQYNFKQLDAKLRRAHRKISRRLVGSHNYTKGVMALGKVYRRARNIRMDMLHKATTNLAKTTRVICIEDLDVSALARNHKVARRILDQGWGRFRTMLEYKTVWYGSQLVVVNRWFPSTKLCNACGHKQNGITLDMRTWICTGCGAKHDRDHNASVNILQEGLRVISTASSAETGSEFLPVTTLGESGVQRSMPRIFREARRRTKKSQIR